MKKKSFILLSTALTLMIAFAGCTSSDNNTNKNLSAKDKYRSGYFTVNDRYANDKNSVGITDDNSNVMPQNPNGNNINNGYGYYNGYNGYNGYNATIDNNIIDNNTTDNMYGVSEEIYNKMTDIENIDDARVYVKGSDAYCALKTKNSKELSTANKNKIRELIKEKYKNVKNVYFSYDESALEKLGDFLKRGADDLDTTLKDMFR